MSFHESTTLIISCKLLCDLGQITWPLWASEAHSKTFGDGYSTVTTIITTIYWQLPKCQVTVPSTVHVSSHLTFSIIPLGPTFHCEETVAQRGQSACPKSHGMWTTGHLPILLPVFVLLPWCEGQGLVPGGGSLTAPVGPWGLWRPCTHSSGSAGLPRPGWVKDWWCGLGACRTAKQSLIHVWRPNLDPAAAPAAVLNVEGLHPTDGQLHRGLHAAHGPGWQQVCSACQSLPPGLPMKSSHGGNHLSSAKTGNLLSPRPQGKKVTFSLNQSSSKGSCQSQGTFRKIDFFWVVVMTGRRVLLANI